MALLQETGTFGLLPETRPPWKEFLFSMGTQSIALSLLLIMGLLHPQVLLPEPRDYHFVQLVNTPPPVKHEPAPMRVLAKPEVAELPTPSPDALRLPPPLPKPKKLDEPVAIAPKVEIAAKGVLLLVQVHAGFGRVEDMKDDALLERRQRIEILVLPRERF